VGRYISDAAANPYSGYPQRRPAPSILAEANAVEADALTRSPAIATLVAGRGYTALAAGEGVIGDLPTVPNWVNSNYIYSSNEDWQEVSLPARPSWLDTISPDLDPLIHLEHLEARMLAAFEARRRGTILLLAIEAYRIDHNEVPDSLDQLVGDYLNELPQDLLGRLLRCWLRTAAPTTPLELAQRTGESTGVRY
jgi:hypothetical protein